MDTLELLGVTKDELLGQVVESTAANLVDHLVEEDRVEKEVKTEFTTRIKAAVESAADKIAGGSLEALVEGRIEEIVLQKTNSWGEATGEPSTFRQYLVRRAEEFLVEPVNFKGETSGQANKSSYDRFKPDGTRIAWMIDQHLQYHISAAMKEALKVANETIVGGIEAAVKLKLVELSEAMKVELKVPR